MAITLLSFFLLSFFLSVSMLFLLLKKISISKKSVPRVGGFAIWLSFIVSLIFFAKFNAPSLLVFGEIKIILITSTMMFLVGVIDDKKELSAFMQFLAQSVIALFAIFLGLRTHIVGIGIMGNYIVTLFWIVGITNAFNHLDIVDGLSAGIALICAMSFCVVSLLTGNSNLAIVFALLAGSVLGFLKYNFPSAKIFMGNAGSHFLGYVLGTLSILISYASFERKIALLVPLVILGVPIFDTLFVMWMRLLKQKRVWEKSNDHLALRLIAMGYSKKKTVIYMLIFAFIFSMFAIALLKIAISFSYIFLVIVVVSCCALAQRMRKVIVSK